MTWLAVPDFPLYRVSDGGRLQSRFFGTWREIRPTLRGEGYLCVRLFRDGHGHYRLVHRLVLEAFAGPCPEGMMTCHNNGIPSDNRLCNLRWDTMKGNMRDRIDHGTDCRGMKNGRAKLSYQEVATIRAEIGNGVRNCELARRFGISQVVISAIKMGRRWSHVS